MRPHLHLRRRTILCALFATGTLLFTTVPAYASSIIAMKDMADLLPLARWGDAVGGFFANQGASIDNIGPWIGSLQRDSIAGNLMGFSSFLWQTILHFMSQALTLNILDYAGQQLDQAAQLIGRIVWGSNTSTGIAIIAIIAAVIWILWKAMRGGGGGILRQILPRIFAIALIVLLTFPSGIGTYVDKTNANGQKIAATDNLRPGTAVWYIDTVNDLSSAVAAPVMKASGLFNSITTHNPVTEGDELDCSTAVAYMKQTFTDADTSSLSAVKNIVDDGYTDKEASLIISQLWEDSVMRVWIDIQFGDSLEGSRIYCRVLDDFANIPPQDQYSLTVTAAGEDSFLATQKGGAPFAKFKAGDKMDAYVGFAGCAADSSGWSMANMDVNLAAVKEFSDAPEEKRAQLLAELESKHGVSLGNPYKTLWSRLSSQDSYKNAVQAAKSGSLWGLTKAGAGALWSGAKASISTWASMSKASISLLWGSRKIDRAADVNVPFGRDADTICSEWWAGHSEESSAVFPPEFNWNSDTIDVYASDMSSGTFLLSLSGAQTNAGTLKSVAALVSSILAFLGFGALAVGVFAAKLALGVHAVMLGFLLLASLLPGQDTGAKLAKTAKTFLGYGLVSTFATLILAIIMLMTNILNATVVGVAGAGSLFSILWTGFAPAICIWLLKKLFDKFGIPNPLSVTGALSWGAAAGGVGGSIAGGLVGGTVGGLVARGGGRARQLATGAAASAVGNTVAGRGSRTGGRRGGGAHSLPPRGTPTKKDFELEKFVEERRKLQGSKQDPKTVSGGASGGLGEKFRGMMKKNRVTDAYKNAQTKYGSARMARRAALSEVGSSMVGFARTGVRVGAKGLGAAALASMGPAGWVGAAALMGSEVKHFNASLDRRAEMKRQRLLRDYHEVKAEEVASRSKQRGSKKEKIESAPEEKTPKPTPREKDENPALKASFEPPV